MARGKARTIKIGSRRYHCHAVKVRAFGKRGKNVTRAYCKRVHKKGKR